MKARQWSWILLVLGCVSVAWSDTRPGSGAAPVQIHGAGATFPAPLYKKWLLEYTKLRSEAALSYAAIGSGDGTKQFIAEEVDFGASDAAMSDEEMAKVQRGVQLVPVVAGNIVLAYNLPGVEGELKLKRDVYVDIFLGKITTWNDPRIQATNPDIKLPPLHIAVAVRQDSSGTTYAFTNHLSAISDSWRDRGPGVGKVIGWPGPAMVARGNEGVAGRIKLSRGAIGYVEYGIASRAGLTMAWLENRAGQFVRPDGDSGMATLESATMPDNLRLFFPDPGGQDSYPIVTYSWLLLYKNYNDPLKAAALKRYVTWCLTEGQAFNEALGYVRLTPDVIARATAAVEGIQ